MERPTSNRNAVAAQSVWALALILLAPIAVVSRAVRSKSLWSQTPPVTTWAHPTTQSGDAASHFKRQF